MDGARRVESPDFTRHAYTFPFMISGLNSFVMSLGPGAWLYCRLLCTPHACRWTRLAPRRHTPSTDIAACMVHIKFSDPHRELTADSRIPLSCTEGARQAFSLRVLLWRGLKETFATGSRSAKGVITGEK